MSQDRFGECRDANHKKRQSSRQGQSDQPGERSRKLESRKSRKSGRQVGVVIESYFSDSREP